MGSLHVMHFNMAVESISYVPVDFCEKIRDSVRIVNKKGSEMKLANTKEFRLAVRAVIGYSNGWTDKVSDPTMRRVGFSFWIGDSDLKDQVAEIKKHLAERNLYVENLRATESGYIRGKALFCV
jgi:hypothetical protein